MTCKSLSDTTMESRADRHGPPSILSPALPSHALIVVNSALYSTVTAMSIGQPQKSSSRLLFQYLLGSLLRVYLFDLRGGF